MTNKHDVTFYYLPAAEYSLGFNLLYRKLTLKLDLDAGGIPAMESFIAAMIASGINTEEEILDYISDITGLHSEDRVRVILMEGENIHWYKLDNGTFAQRISTNFNTGGVSKPSGLAGNDMENMSTIDVANIVVRPQNQPSPVERSTCDPERKRAPAGEGFSAKRLVRDDFPDPPEPRCSVPLTMPNVAYLLRENGIVLGYDVIKKRVIMRQGTFDVDECDLVSLGNLNGLTGNKLFDFVQTQARRRAINPVAAWIDSVPWDGTDRLKALYATVEVDDEYPQAMRDFLLYRWLLSCVAAVLKPQGFKARGVLVFQGEQGLGKTSWINRLVPSPMNAEWVKLDHHLDAHNKDSVFGAMTHWIVEVGELDGSFRRDIARLKGLLTNDCDKLRLPYARSPIELPRRTVFAGTVNEWHFLIDQTGNSRWWTIPVVGLDYGHDIDMQQVFAQLAVDFRNGEQWWLTGPEEAQLAEQNTRHAAVSVIEERLRIRIDPEGEKTKYLTATKVLEEIGIRNPTNAQCKECGGILRSIYGPPKRVHGLMRWKVAFKPDSTWGQGSTDPDENEY